MTQNTRTICQKMMKMMIDNFKKFIYIFIGMDIILISISCLKGVVWLLNTQIAYFCSVIVVVGSYIGYMKMINSRVAKLNQDYKYKEDRDLIDKLEDPYDLYDDERESEDVKKDKFKSIKDGYKNTKNSITGFLSPYRLFGYALLFGAVIFLIQTSLFLPFAFLSGVSVALVCIFVFSYLTSKSIYKNK